MSGQEKNAWDRGDDISILEVFDITTGKRQVLREFPYLIEAPNWSPDGESLIYNSRGLLWRYRLATGESQRIDTGFATGCNNDHLISRDGKWLAISHSDGRDGGSRVYVLPGEGGEPRLITPKAPSYLHGISPDGGTLAYCAQREGEFDIYTAPAAGGAETRLTHSPGLNDGPEYSPDGRHIWFNSVRSGLMQVLRMEADGSRQTQMSFDPDWNSWFPHLSPDGKWVVMLAYRKGDLPPNATGVGDTLPRQLVLCSG